jgi:hypothetical protein
LSQEQVTLVQVEVLLLKLAQKSLLASCIMSSPLSIAAAQQSSFYMVF